MRTCVSHLQTSFSSTWTLRTKVTCHMCNNTLHLSLLNNKSPRLCLSEGHSDRATTAGSACCTRCHFRPPPQPGYTHTHEAHHNYTMHITPPPQVIQNHRHTLLAFTLLSTNDTDTPKQSVWTGHLPLCEHGPLYTHPDREEVDRSTQTSYGRSPVTRLL